MRPARKRSAQRPGTRRRKNVQGKRTTPTIREQPSPGDPVKAQTPWKHIRSKQVQNPTPPLKERKTYLAQQRVNSLLAPHANKQSGYITETDTCPSLPDTPGENPILEPTGPRRKHFTDRAGATLVQMTNRRCISAHPGYAHTRDTRTRANPVVDLRVSPDMRTPPPCPGRNNSTRRNGTFPILPPLERYLISDPSAVMGTISRTTPAKAELHVCAEGNSATRAKPVRT